MIYSEVIADKNFANSQQLSRMLNAPVAWQLLELALQQNLFDLLLQPCSVMQIAQHYQFDLEATELWLNALTSLGLLHKENQQYCLTNDFLPLLNSQAENYIGQHLLQMAAIRHTSPGQLKALMRGKAVKQSMSMDSPEFWQNSLERLRSYHNIMAPQQLRLLQQLPQWRSMNTVLDVGAGSDVFARLICQRWPQKNVVVSDLSGCIQAIKQQSDNIPDNIRLRSGDYNRFDIREKFDLIWCSMNFYYANDLPTLLQQLSECLNPGGLLISIHEGLSNERCQPSEHIIGRFIPALKGNNRSFNHGEIRSAMQQAGFSMLPQHTMMSLYGPLVVDIGSIR